MADKDSSVSPYLLRPLRSSSRCAAAPAERSSAVEGPTRNGGDALREGQEESIDSFRSA